ncbi:MAG: glycosyltransferase [Luteitalea sp.]|nr:glycosyltransferase [Luteitalea sp.]
MKRPTFSIVIETANLSKAELTGLQRTLESMSQQSVPMEHANAVVIVDSGDVPDEVLQQTLNVYPWIRVLRFPSSTGYEELKMEGLNGTTGNVVVFADGDCVYDNGWLEALLVPFLDDSVSVVGGELRHPLI